MIDTSYTTLNQRPETFDIVSVDLSTDILFDTMANSKVREANPSYSIITEYALTNHFICGNIKSKMSKV